MLQYVLSCNSVVDLAWWPRKRSHLLHVGVCHKNQVSQNQVTISSCQKDLHCLSTFILKLLGFGVLDAETHTCSGGNIEALTPRLLLFISASIAAIAAWKPPVLRRPPPSISTTISNKRQDSLGKFQITTRQAEGLRLGDLTLQFANALLTLTSTALSEQVRMAHTLITLEPTLGIKIPTPKSVWT